MITVLYYSINTGVYMIWVKGIYAMGCCLVP